MRGIVATWVAAHRGLEALAGAALATLLVATLGWRPIDVFGDAQPPPLWAMYPGMMALIATTVGRDRLAGLTRSSPRRFVVPRAAWLLAVTLSTWLLALLTQAALNQRAIWILCVGLAVIPLGVSTLWRPLGLIVAGSVEVWAVSSASRVAFASDDPPAEIFHRLGPSWVLVWWGVVALCGVVYVLRGE